MNLSVNRLAAKNAADGDGRAHRQSLHLGDDLLREFTSRREHNRLRTACSRFQHFDQGNPECRCLPGARLGLPDDVETVKSFRNKSRLNGGGRLVAAAMESLEHCVAQAHGLEPSTGFLNNLSNQSILRKHSSVNTIRSDHFGLFGFVSILSV